MAVSARAKADGVSQGLVIDRAIMLLPCAETGDPVVHGDGSGSTVRRSEVVEGDYTKLGTFTVRHHPFKGPLLKPSER